ncbi:fimbrial protein, partial [Salmonella enterica]
PINISAGIFFSVVSIIYRGAWYGGDPGMYHLLCTSTRPPETVNYTYNLGIQSAPMTLANTAQYDGKVYNTTIPGIGVIISDGANAVSQSAPYANGGIRQLTMNSRYMSHMIYGSTRYLSLIKIGPIYPGSYALNASSLPTAMIYYDNAPGYPAIPGLPVVSNILEFSGSINITAQTCTTPDIIVPMGSYDANQDFDGVGSTTGWIKTNLELKNCPAFYGFYDASNTAQLFNWDQGGASHIPAPTSNTIGAYFSPNTAIVDSANGIMSIDTSAPSSASGVGIQLGWGDGAPVPFNLSVAQILTLPRDGRSNVSVPLYARYIQTDGIITPGRADGKVTFTISYY